MAPLKHLLVLPILIPVWAANAEIVDSTLDVEDVTRVQLSGDFELLIQQGDEEFVTVTTEREYLDKIEAVVENGELRLASKENRSWNWFDQPALEARFTVQVKNLEALVNRGAGKIEIGNFSSKNDLQISNVGSGDITIKTMEAGELNYEGRGSGELRMGTLRAQSLTAESAGSGEMRIRTLVARSASMGIRGSGDIEVGGGEVEALELSISGSGDISTHGLKAQTATVTIRGSGDIELTVSESLTANIYGSGDIKYDGNPPNVTRNVRGSGEIEAH